MNNKEMTAQEIITTSGNYFVSLKDNYIKENEKETNVLKYIENKKAIEILNTAIDFFVYLQKELEKRMEVTDETSA